VPSINEPLVSCLCPTYGRFEKLCEAVSCFVAQDYVNKEMVILNSHPVPLHMDLPQVRIINDPSLFFLGDIHNRLLDEAKGELVRTWDDDDLYLPYAISQGVRMLPNDKVAWKPLFSWSWRNGRDPILYGNQYEASTTWRADFMRSVRFEPGVACKNYRQILDKVAEIRGLAKTDMRGEASYVYRFGWGPAHISVASSRADNQTATEEWRGRNQDTGDGKPISIVPLQHYWDVLEARTHELFDACEDGWWVERPMGRHAWNMERVFEGVEWARANGSKTLGVIAASIITAYSMSTVIEIGIRAGFTTQVLARALSASMWKNALLISCDISDRTIPRAKQVVEGLPLQTIRICGDSTKLDWESLLDGRILDGALIDGDHSHDMALADLRNMGNLLRPGGIIWFHDYFSQKGPTGAADEFLKETNWGRLVLPRSPSTNDAGSMIIQKPM